MFENEKLNNYFTLGSAVNFRLGEYGDTIKGKVTKRTDYEIEITNEDGDVWSMTFREGYITNIWIRKKPYPVAISSFNFCD